MPPHLKELYEKASAVLDEEQRCLVTKVLTNFQDVFAKNDDDLGRTDEIRHMMNTGESPPIRQAPRTLPFHKRKEAQEEIERMLERGIIEPSDSPWASPIVLVRKKDDGVRFCVDYRQLNAVTIKDEFPSYRRQH